MSRPKGYWRNLTLFALFTLSLALAGAGLWLAYTLAMTLVHPGRTQATRTPADLGITAWEGVRFPSADGLELSGWFIPSDPQSGDGATLIFVHGLANNREGLLDEAALLASHGYGVLLFDLRNHGQSQGTVTTLGYAEVDDVRGAVSYLLNRPEVNPDRIGLFGNSLGAAITLRAAARIPQVRVVIAQSAFTSLEDNIASGVRALTGLPPVPFAPLVVWFGELETGVSIHEVRPIDDIPLIAPRAVLLIHGKQDSTILPRNSLQLYQAAHEPKRLYLSANAGHGDLLNADPEAYEREVVTFLETYLGGEP
ncbi:MAG: alpha/beta hydrolase [Anaerolineales bacterium]